MSFLLGVWLLAAPDVLGYDDPAAANDRIVGPIAAGFAFVAIWEVTRGLRWAVLPLAAWLIVAPWALGYELAPLVNSLVVGLLLAALSFLGARVEGSYGGGWHALFSRRS